MSREALEDFAALKGFLKSFSYDALLADRAYEDILRGVHRHHLALLTALAELSTSETPLGRQFLADYGTVGLTYLSEVGSDCSEFVLAIASGMFRAAGMTLRSSIESFAKSMSVADHPEVLKQTSVPSVFEIAEESAFFLSAIPNHAFSGLRAVYAELNHFAHTVGEPNIFGAHSAGSFPYSSDTTAKLASLFAKVVRGYLVALVGGRRDLFDQFDHRNKAIVVASLTKPQRRLVFG
ncbi:MAG: hypothetical protein WBW32_06935 [Luteibacter sp.]